MLLVSIHGGRRMDLYRDLVGLLASSGYRVASFIQERRLGLPKELKRLAEAGAGTSVAVGPNRILTSSTFVPNNLKDLIRIATCLNPVRPDVLVFVGFEDVVGTSGEVAKLLAVWSAKEAESLLSTLSPPILGIHSHSDDVEEGFSSLRDLSEEVLRFAYREGKLPPRVERP